MTIVISDTGPLNYLVLIESIDVLSRVFDQVIIPDSVLDELNHERTPDAVRNWAGELPQWAVVESSVTETEELKEASLRVDRGELSAMAVALKKGLPILMDDRRARQAAEELGISTFGTLAVLEIAANAGWLDFNAAAYKLREYGFYVTDALIEEISARIRMR